MQCFQDSNIASLFQTVNVQRELRNELIIEHDSGRRANNRRELDRTMQAEHLHRRQRSSDISEPNAVGNDERLRAAQEDRQPLWAHLSVQEPLVFGQLHKWLE